MGEFSNPEGYELWMGRWSARLAPAFVKFANLPEGGRFLDVGSGTGVLAQALLAELDSASVVGIEPAEAYVEYTRGRVRDRRASFQRGDALDIPFTDDAFDATLSLLILQELPDAPRAVAEMRRVTRPGGCVAASQWHFEKGMPMLALFWDAVLETIGTPEARQAAADCMSVEYPDGEALRDLWMQAGLVDVQTRLQEIEMPFQSFDDYWAPFSTSVTPSSSYTSSLPEDQRRSLEDCVRRKFAGQAAGEKLTLTAKAWAVKGSVPG